MLVAANIRFWSNSVTHLTTSNTKWSEECRRSTHIHTTGCFCWQEIHSFAYRLAIWRRLSRFALTLSGSSFDNGFFLIPGPPSHVSSDLSGAAYNVNQSGQVQNPLVHHNSRKWVQKCDIDYYILTECKDVGKMTNQLRVGPDRPNQCLRGWRNILWSTVSKEANRSRKLRAVISKHCRLNSSFKN